MLRLKLEFMTTRTCIKWRTKVLKNHVNYPSCIFIISRFVPSTYTVTNFTHDDRISQFTGYILVYGDFFCNEDTVYPAFVQEIMNHSNNLETVYERQLMTSSRRVMFAVTKLSQILRKFLRLKVSLQYIINISYLLAFTINFFFTFPVDISGWIILVIGTWLNRW